MELRQENYEALTRILKEYGFFCEPYDPEYISLAFYLNIGDVGDLFGLIDIENNDDGTFEIGKVGVPFYVSEYTDVQKILSVFYGSIFSLRLERVDIKWVRYVVNILSVSAPDLQSCKEVVRTLKILLEKLYQTIDWD